MISIRAAPDTSIISGADPTLVSTSDPIRLFIIQASIIIIFTRILAYFLAKIRQPAVIAEVIGGILLGPTVFGRIPGFTAHIFPQASLPYLNLVANLGLVLFLFIVGLEVDTRIVRKCAVSSTAISLSGLVIPFGLGAAVSVGIYNDFIDTTRVTFGHFLLFTGVAMAITALPVLARIVLDLKLIKTRVGVVVLAAGVGNDVVGWILLALAIALVNASSGINALYIFLVVVAWTLLLFFAVRPAFIALARRTGSLMNGPTHTMMTITILLVFASAFLTDCIGVHAIFGAFLVGLIMPHEGGFALALTEKLEDIVSVIFLPLYFALSGLNTNLATLDSGLIWGYIIAICVIAFFSKFFSCAAAARLTGFSMRESAAVGTLMSCKGLVELIVLNLGLSAGILNTRVFSMFVVMAIVSTCATTPLTLLVYPPRYRVKFQEGSVHTQGQDDEDDAASRQGAVGRNAGVAATSKYLFVLDRFEHLPGLLTLVQVLRPSSDAHLQTSPSGGTLRRRYNGSTEKSEGDGASSLQHNGASTDGGHASSVPVLLDQSAAYAMSQAPASVDALRLVELTERTSAVMRVAESDDTVQADPLINVFRAFVRLNKLPVQSALHVVSSDEFSSTVTDRARDASANFVIIPWTLPAAGLLGGANNGNNSGGLFARPVETLFGTGTSDRAEITHHYQAAFVRRVVQTSPCHVGMLLERSAAGRVTVNTVSPAAWGQHVLFAFMGGPDDRCALEMVLQWCKVNEDVYASVYRYRKSDASADDLRSPPATLQHIDTVRRDQAANALYGNHSVHDTMYPQSDLNPLQAQLQDDVAIDNAERARQADEDLAQRLRIHECTTPTPLTHLIGLIKRNGSSAADGAEQEAEAHTNIPPPSMVVMGRNRRMPTITHRDELRQLLRGDQYGEGKESGAAGASTSTSQNTSLESRLIDGEMSKIIGQAAMAVCGVAQSNLPTLVVASSLHQPAIGEDA